MNRVDSVEQYSSLLNSYIQSRCDMVYNHILLPDKAQAYIESGLLFVEKREGAVIFSCEERDFYKLYYLIPKRENIRIEHKNKAQTIEYFFREGKTNKMAEAAHKKNIDMGFTEYVKNIRVRLDITEYNDSQMIKTGRQSPFSWNYATKTDLDKIYELWAGLDKYDSTIPTEAAARTYVNNGQLILLEKDKQIVGVSLMKAENQKTASIWLSAIDKMRRGEGLGTLLYQTMIEVIKEKGFNFVWQWCDVKNEAIINLSKKLGFKREGLTSQIYILQ